MSGADYESPSTWIVEPEAGPSPQPSMQKLKECIDRHKRGGPLMILRIGFNNNVLAQLERSCKNVALPENWVSPDPFGLVEGRLCQSDADTLRTMLETCDPRLNTSSSKVRSSHPNRGTLGEKECEDRM